MILGKFVPQKNSIFDIARASALHWEDQLLRPSRSSQLGRERQKAQKSVRIDRAYHKRFFRPPPNLEACVHIWHCLQESTGKLSSSFIRPRVINCKGTPEHIFETRLATMAFGKLQRMTKMVTARNCNNEKNSVLPVRFVFETCALNFSD